MLGHLTCFTIMSSSALVPYDAGVANAGESPVVYKFVPEALALHRCGGSEELNHSNRHFEFRDLVINLSSAIHRKSYLIFLVLCAGISG